MTFIASAIDRGRRPIRRHIARTRPGPHPLWLEQLEPRTLFNGTLDPTFDNDGFAIEPFDSISQFHVAYPQDVVVQTDGKILVAGFAQDPVVVRDGRSVLVRYNPDGSLDTTFGSGGRAIFQFGINGIQAINDVDLLPNGQILIAGFRVDNFNAGDEDSDGFVAKLNVDGSLDRTFGVNGVVEFGSETTRDNIKGIAVQSDGRIVAALRSLFSGANPSFVTMSAVRFTASGVLDQTFGTAGVAGTTLGSALIGDVFDVRVNGNDEVYLFGEASSPTPQPPLPQLFLPLIKFDADGQLDTTFADNGVLRVVFAPDDAASVSDSDFPFLSDDKIVVVGTNFNSDIAINRYNPDGSPDTSFGVEGRVTVGDANDGEIAQALVVQSDGRLVIAGGVTFQNGQNQFDFGSMLVRLLDDGQPDPSFGNNGFVSVKDVNALRTLDSINAVTLDELGNIVAVGPSNSTSGAPSDFVTARFLASSADDDGDGVGNDVEDAVDGDGDGQPDGDGNQDGVLDSLQDHVASLPNGVLTGFVTVIADAGAGHTLANVATGAAFTNAAINMAGGSVAFEVHGVTPGGAADVTVLFQGGVASSTYIKSGATTEDPTPHLYEFDFDGTTGVEVFNDDPLAPPNRFELHFVDGGRGDDDAAADGVIRDPGGPGNTPSGAIPSISGTVFHDVNRNSLFEPPAESPLAGWTVNVTGGGGTRSIVTDAQGNYRFDGLDFGSYSVKPVFEPGWIPSTTFGGLAVQVPLFSGNDTIAGIDFGARLISGAGEIRGTTFRDDNANGVRDTGEPGLPGTLVYIDVNKNGVFDFTSDIRTTSGANGTYTFTLVAPGDYEVRQQPADGHVQTFPASGMQNVSVTANQIVTNVDFGSAPPGTISGVKWRDDDADGVRDADEPGLANVTIYIDLNGSGAFDAATEPSAVTGADGTYAILNAPAGAFDVREVAVAGTIGRFPASSVHAVTLAAGQLLPGVNFGNELVSPASISGIKFADLDGDGVQEAGEVGLPGFTIFLDIDNDNVLTPGIDVSTVTGADGSYAFTNLVAGRYFVAEIQQFGFTKTAPQFPKYSVQLAAGEARTALDFGNLPPAGFEVGQISGVKYHDQNGNGARDLGEPGLAGWTIFLDENNNGVFDLGEPTSLTGADGSYSFTNVAQQVFQVGEVLRPNWLNTAPPAIELASTMDVGFGPERVALADVDFDGNEDAIVQNLGIVSVFPGMGDGTFGAATFQHNMIGSLGSVQSTLKRGLEVADFNRDGLPDIAVAGSGSVIYSEVVIFFNSNGTFNAPTNIHLPDRPSAMTVADVDGVNGPDIILTDGTTASLGALVLLLNDGNGNFTRQVSPQNLGTIRPDSIEPIDIDGDVDVDLIVGDVNNNRLIILENQGGGSFTFPADIGLSSPPRGIEAADLSQDGSTDLAIATDGGVVVLLNNGAGAFSEQGVYPTAGSLARGGLVATDIDGDGDLDLAVADTGGTQVTVLYNAGQGAFTPGATIPSGQSQYDIAAADLDHDGTPDLVTVNHTPDTLSVLLNGRAPTQTVDLTTSPMVTGVDFGNQHTASGRITGTKWRDNDGDGVRDPGDVGLANWTFFLDFDGDLQLDANEPRTVTDADGDYAFENLPPGQYSVVEVQRAGWVRTTPFVANFLANVSAGQTTGNIDFGNQPPATITGAVYRDTDADGVRDANEPGMSGVTVYLDTNDNDVLDAGEVSKLTDGYGAYSFDVLGGTYHVKQLLTQGFEQSDPVAAGYTLNVQHGTQVSDIDFGQSLPRGSIAGRVFDDLDGDGFFEPIGIPPQPSELGVAGVTVYLDLNRNGQADAGEPTTVTDSGGLYVFDNLPSGRNYAVRFLTPDGYAPLPTDLTFDTPLIVDVGVRAVVSADFNNDGFTDIATANHDSESLSILINRGDGTFNNAVSFPSSIAEPNQLVVAYIDEDNLPDLVVGSASHGSLDTLINLGDGSFFASGVVNLGASATLESLKAADFDNDGDDDVVAIDRTNDRAWVLFNSTGLSVSGPDDVLIPVGEQPVDVAVGDLNNDGLIDIAVAHRGPRPDPQSVGVDPGPGFVMEILNTGNGTFGAPTMLDTSVELNRGVSADDVDGDGDLDLTVFNNPASSSTTGLGRGGGTFGFAFGLSVDFVGGTSENLNANLVFLEGRGDGSFVAPTVDVVTQFMGVGIVADLAGDGAGGANNVLDIAVPVAPRHPRPEGGFRSHGGLAVFINGSATPVVYDVGDNEGTPVAVDIDLDGDIDLIVPDLDSRQVVVMRNAGDGTFGRSIVSQHDVFLQAGGSGAVNLAVSLDNDSDGIAESVEAGAPNNGDGNNDGVPDAEQPDVASFRSPVTGEYLTIVAPAGATLVDVQITESAPTYVPQRYALPIGVLGFRIEGIGVGLSKTFELFLHNYEPDSRTFDYAKYGPTHDNPSAHWYVLDRPTEARFNQFFNPAILVHPYDVVTGIQQITVRLVDGADGDADLTANGVIVDPGALVLTDTPPTTATIDYDRDTAEDSKFTFTDADGNETTVQISGAGFVDIALADGALDNADIASLTFRDTDPAKTKVSVKVKKADGADGETSIGSIQGTGVRSIDAKQSDIVGDGVMLTGALGDLRIDDIADGASITMVAAANDKFKLTADRVGNVNLTTFGLIDKIVVTDWLAGGITALAAKTVQTKGDKRNNVPGDFGASIGLVGDASLKQNLASLSVAGGASDVVVSSPGVVGKVQIKGAATDVSVFADEVSQFTAGISTDLSINAGTVGKLSLESWDGGGGAIDELKSLQIKANKRTGSDGSLRNVALMLQGGADIKQTIGKLKVDGPTQNVTLDATGDTGSIEFTGDVDQLDLTVHSTVKQLKLGDVASANVNVDAIGAVQAVRWLSGAFVANTVKSIKTTGDSRSAVPGDLSVDITILGDGDDKTLELGNSTIKGVLAGNWFIDGNAGKTTADAVGAMFHGEITGVLQGLTTKQAGFEGLLAAAVLDSLSIKTDVMNAAIIAGSAADGLNTAGKLSIGGDLINSTIKVGLRSGDDGMFETIDDYFINDPAHTFSALTIGGAADAESMLFFASGFPTSVKINRDKVDPLIDNRFVIVSGPIPV